MNARMTKLHFHVDGYLIESRNVAMVEMEPGERVSEAIKAGVMVYADAGELYAFVCKIPAGVDEFAEISVADALVTLVQASWVPMGVVMVGRGGYAVRGGLWAGAEKKYMEVANV